MTSHHAAFPSTYVDSLDGEITIEEVQMAIDKSKNNKAPGEDRISFEFFKNAPTNFIQNLKEGFNNIFNSGRVPESFLSNIIFPLFKKGDVNDPANYRGISFQNTLLKLFTSILLARLTTWVELNGLLSEYQAGFRANYSTVDNIFVLTNIGRLYLQKGKKLYAFFIDFRAAFDTVDRRALFLKLCNKGMSYKMLQVLESMYTNNQSAVWDGNSMSEWFGTSSGVKQGCQLSPLFFCLFLDDLLTSLPGGIEFDNSTIKGLLFADDIVLLAETPNMLQLMINRLEEYCKQWNLVVNTEKSKIMVFRNSTGRYSLLEKWNLGQDQIEVVKEYRYLGVTITPKFSFNLHLQNKLKESKKALSCSWKNVLCRKDVPFSSKHKLFEATARSVMCYACQVWGYEEYEEVE